ncbi:MAG: hypothetical protein JRD89_17370 [Deltaproteobacteria bacterium]|nr:hypothetical protein [Deltaproteobacteria bacterium]
MAVYRVGRPYRVIRRDGEDPHAEMVHGYRYEHVYSFVTGRELTLSEMRDIYFTIIRDPAIPQHARIRYFECSSFAGSPARGRVVVQFESLHPIPHAVLAAMIIAAVAVILAVATLIVAPTLAAAYRLTTSILEMPGWLLLVVAGGFALALLYVFLRARGPERVAAGVRAWRERPRGLPAPAS